MKKGYLIRGWYRDQIRYVAPGMNKAVVPTVEEAWLFNTHEEALMHMVNNCDSGFYKIESIYYILPKKGQDSQDETDSQNGKEKQEKDG